MPIPALLMEITTKDRDWLQAILRVELTKYIQLACECNRKQSFVYDEKFGFSPKRDCLKDVVGDKRGGLEFLKFFEIPTPHVFGDRTGGDIKDFGAKRMASLNDNNIVKLDFVRGFDWTAINLNEPVSCHLFCNCATSDYSDGREEIVNPHQLSRRYSM